MLMKCCRPTNRIRFGLLLLNIAPNHLKLFAKLLTIRFVDYLLRTRDHNMAIYKTFLDLTCSVRSVICDKTRFDFRIFDAPVLLFFLLLDRVIYL